MADQRQFSDKSQAYSARQLAGLLLGLALCIVLLLAPSLDPENRSVNAMAAIALLMAVWWITEAAPIPVTALLPMVLFPAFGILDTASTTRNYAHQLVFLFMGGFLIAAAMVKWNLHKRIALLTIRNFGTEPHRLVLGFMVAAGFLSMWITNIATTLMLMPTAMAVVEQMSQNARLHDEGPNSDVAHLVKQNLGLALMLGIAYSASIGGIGTLIGTAPNGIFIGMANRFFKDQLTIPSFGEWMLVALPLVIVMIPVTWFVVTRLAPDVRLRDFEFSVGSREVIDRQLAELGPMSSGEKKVAMVFASAAILWMTRKPIPLGPVEIPGWSQLVPNPEQWSDTTVAMMMGLLLFVLPASLRSFSFKNPGSINFVLDWKTARKHVPWGILLLFGGGFALADGFASSGLSAYLAESLQFLHGLPLILVVLVVTTLIIFMTELTSNTATTTLILPILAVAAVDLGQHPYLLMIPATMAASCAFMLPVATPPNAIVFGSKWVTVPKMTKAGIWLNLVSIVVITLLAFLVLQSLLNMNPEAIPTRLSG